MFVIKCPYCGERDQTEFTAKGEAHIVRPKDPDALTEKEWGDYVFFRSNIKGPQYERWVHTHGCRRWFNVMRNTHTDEILAVYKVGEAKPQLEDEA